MTQFSAFLIGNETLTLQCGEMLLARGHSLAAVVTRNADVRHWAQGKGLRVEGYGAIWRSGWASGSIGCCRWRTCR